MFVLSIEKKPILSNKNFYAERITSKYLGRSKTEKFNTRKINFNKSSVCILWETTFFFADVQSFKGKYFSSNR